MAHKHHPLFWPLTSSWGLCKGLGNEPCPLEANDLALVWKRARCMRQLGQMDKLGVKGPSMAHPGI